MPFEPYKVVRRGRLLPNGRKIRLNALTDGQSEDKQRAFAAGFDAHLAKPAELATLQRTLAKIL